MCRHLPRGEDLSGVGNIFSRRHPGVLERLHHWLHESLPQLDRRTPLRAIADGKIDEVHTVLANVDTGV